MDEKSSAKKWTGQLRKLHDDDANFNLDFWQSQTSAQRFRAAWELVEHHAKRRGISSDELRLKRTAQKLIRSRA
jgi:hypothetical protein